MDANNLPQTKCIFPQVYLMGASHRFLYVHISAVVVASAPLWVWF